MALQPLFIRGWKQLSAYVGGALLVKGVKLNDSQVHKAQ